MKIFRALDAKETQALRAKNNIFYEHKTCHREDWILNPHPEDYRTGKFFFFTMEDALSYAQHTYTSHQDYDDGFSVIEMDIDEKYILPYICYGIYCYDDQDEEGYWRGMYEHAIPELLLPYKIVDSKIKNKEYKLIKFKREIYSWETENDKYKFDMPYEKDRPKPFVEFGNALMDLLICIELVGYHKKLLEEDDNEYRRESLQEAQEDYAEYAALFPQAFEKFMDCQRNYEWKDFRKPADSHKGKGHKLPIKKADSKNSVSPQLGE